MSEEPKDTGQPNPQQDLKDTKDAVKDGANLAKNAASGNYLGAIKDGIKLLGNKKARKIILISLLLPIIVTVAIAGSLFSIFDKVGDVIQSIVDGIIGFFTINNKDWDGSINVDDDQIDKIIEGIETMGFDMEDLSLMGDVDYSTIDKESEEYKKILRKYIKKFYEAQAVTETPFANLGTSTNKTYGAVYIYRRNEDDKKELLKYMNYSNEDKTDGMITYEGKTVSKSKLKSIRKYYSLDDEGKIVVPTWTEMDGTITVSLKHIDYKNSISQYTTPMNFFVYLAMTVQNPEFVSAVTELVKDTRIDITLFDSVNEIKTTETYTYIQHEKGSRAIHALGSDGSTVPVNNSNDVKEINTTQTSTTNPIPQITYVKTWFCEQTVEYEINDSGFIDQQPTILNKDNDESLQDEQGPAEDEVIPDGETVKWNTDKQKTIEISTRNVSYKETTRTEVTDRTGDKGDQGVKNVNSERKVPDNYTLDENTTFLGLMDDYFRIPNSKKYEAVSKNNLITGANWLFGLLQKDARLQTLEQIMRYIMYKYTGNDYGVTELDLSIFEIKDFVTIGGSGSSAQLKKYIRYWENAGGPPTNGDNYIIEDDGAGHPTVGYGVDIENSGYKQKFIDAGYPTTIGGEVPIEFVDAIEEEILKNSKSSVEAIVSGLNLKQYQINALISRSYNCGVNGALATLRGSPSLNFVDSYNKYWKAEDDLYETNPEATEANFNHSLYTQYMSKPTTSEGVQLQGLVTRRKSEWTLFQTGYYDVLRERHATFTGNTVKAGGYEFPHYLQKDFSGPYGTSTIPSSGCGPTSLAMILAGLLGDPSITPNTVVDAINEYWPDGSYYVPGAGSSHCIFNNDFLNKYYGVTSTSCSGEADAVRALEEGGAVIGGEDGHILAIIPVPDEYKSQGYKFYILDSARGHSGPYKSSADANRVVKGSLRFISIIKP